jgi:hypothetical protein
MLTYSLLAMHLKEYKKLVMNNLKKIILSLWLFTITFTVAAQNSVKVPNITTFITAQAKQYKGMFNIYVQQDKYYMEIPRPLFGRDILAAITINAGSAQLDRDPQKRFGFSGDAVYDMVFRFKLYKNSNVLLEQPQFYNAPDSTGSYYNLIKSKIMPIAMAFNVVAEGTNSVLFDITEAMNSDLPIFSLSGAKEDLGLGSYQANLSYPVGIATYQNNIVFRTIKAYGPGSNTPAPKPGLIPMPTKPEENKGPTGPTVWEVGACWYLLPEIPMGQRWADERVGYFTKIIRDYTTDSKVKELPLATRWRLEPKEEDMAKYLKGELVEPKKPIVYYIDKNTPEYLKPYFTAGVNAWQKAFEKIGFKNAIMAKPEPSATEDPEFAIDNMNYSIISYKPSLTPNAYGPSVVDPRSGEILNTHIAVFHNIFDLLQRWYFVMCATADSRAQKLPLDPQLMGTLAQTVITHEVGHTLGLRHNFAGSSTYKIDSIRNKEFISKNGYGASIMDYMRFNYLAQPEDKIPTDQLLPRIGIYDDYAIKWGYQLLPQFADKSKESDYLKSWVSEKRKDNRLLYIQEGDFTDPRVQSEDLGDNAMEASALGIKNLKLVMQNLDAWIGKNDDENYTLLRKMHTAVVSRYNEYLAHVLKNIGGRYTDNALISEHKANYIPVERAKQKEAMAFLKTYFFEEPAWLFPDNITAKTKFFFDGQVAADYDAFSGKIFYRLSALANDQRIAGPAPYTVNEFFDDLYDNFFGNLERNNNISSYQRMLQRSYVNKILTAISNPTNHENDVATILKIQAVKIANNCSAAAKANKDLLSKQHLNAISEMIHLWMDEKISANHQ